MVRLMSIGSWFKNFWLRRKPILKLFNSVHSRFREARLKTIREVGEAVHTWVEWYDTWFFTIYPIVKELPEERSNNSLLFTRLFEFNKHLLLSQELVFIGGYHSVIRELRFVLESACNGFYMDKIFPSFSIDEKIDNSDSFYGVTGLIEKLPVNAVVREKISELYHALSEYVHSTLEELRSGSEEGLDYRVIFAFNKRLFDSCVDFTNRVWDVVIFLVVNEFDFLAEKLKNDTNLIDWLKYTNCELSLSFLIDKNSSHYS